jgi:sporulation protein YlmC with PRC-barrel domain
MMKHAVVALGALALTLPALALADKDAALTKLSAEHFKVDRLVGTDIKNRDGNDIGTVDDVVLDRNGRVAAIIVRTGGLMGVGASTVALSWDQVDVSRDQDDPEKYRLRVAMTQQQLENLPEFDDDAPRTAQAREQREQPRQAQQRQDREQPRQAQQREEQREVHRQARTQLGAEQLKLDRIVGMDIKNEAGDTIGTIDDLVLERDGRIASAIVSTGGALLGIGAKTVVVPWNRLDLSRDQDDPSKYRVRTSMTEDELENLPEFDGDAYSRR